jgi:two-component system sensor histidine kinase AlgZ
MHPLLLTKGRLGLYLLAWAPLAALLAFLLSITGRLPWTEATAMAAPLAAFYAFVCLSPWYLCRVLPLATSRAVSLFLNHASAAVVAGLLWVVLAKVVALGLSRYFADFGTRFNAQLPLVFGVGLLIYLLAVAGHYVLFAMQSSQEAETREQEARVLAREAELKALKMQINPHFLFNSLNSISALATTDGVRAREMCIRLSDFLRSTLRLGERESIPLPDEIALARAYLDVEQVRFGARLRVEEQVESDCAKCIVPPLILQPLVENAVKHGIAGLVEGGTIRLYAQCQDEYLRLRVENEFDADAPPARKNGLGLRNVSNRLKARYANKARLDTSVEENRFVVALTMPCDPDD